MNLDKILQDALEYEKIRDMLIKSESNGMTFDYRRFIDASKNYDCVSVIKELVERVKALTDDFEEAQIIIKDLLKMGLI